MKGQGSYMGWGMGCFFSVERQESGLKACHAMSSPKAHAMV